MPSKLKKQQAKLNARLAAYNKHMQTIKLPDRPEAYTKPGSMNPRKQA